MAEDQVSAPYVSWGTFRNSIETLVQLVPNVIDRTTFPGLSGGVQTQLLSAFKFLGLTNADGKPTDDLHELAVPSEAERKAKLVAILRNRYKDLFALDLTKSTPAEVTNTMGESYAVSGDTREKSVRFFLSALEYTGIPVSRFLSKPKPGAAVNGNRTPRSRRSTPRVKQASASVDETDGDAPAQTGASRQIQLASGGTLTITATIDLFAMSAADRTFVFGLIDKLEEYSKTNTKD